MYDYIFEDALIFLLCPLHFFILSCYKVYRVIIILLLFVLVLLLRGFLDILFLLGLHLEDVYRLLLVLFLLVSNHLVRAIMMKLFLDLDPISNTSLML